MTMELYSKDNAVLLLVDHQVGIMERAVRAPPLDVVRGNVLALARPPGFLWPTSLPGASVASRHPARPRGHDDSSIRRGLCSLSMRSVALMWHLCSV